jgi:hypothetical protein
MSAPTKRGRPRKSLFEDADLLILERADMIWRGRYCAGDPMTAIREAVDLALRTGVYLGGNRNQIVRRVRDRLKPLNIKSFDGQRQRTVEEAPPSERSITLKSHRPAWRF